MEKTKKDRLFEVMEALGLSDYRVYTDVPEITKNMMTKLRNGETKDASSKILEPFCKHYKKVNPSYLLIGDGQMFLSDNTTHPNIDLDDKVPTQKGNEARLTKEQTKGAVPFYGDLPVSAGQNDLAKMLDNMKPTGWLKMDNMPSSIGTFPVIGCSMEPDIKQGDFVSITPVDRWEKIYPDNIYMIITRDDRMIKHLAIDENDDEILWCISPNYPKFKIEKSEILQLYRVVFHGRFA